MHGGVDRDAATRLSVEHGVGEAPQPVSATPSNPVDARPAANLASRLSGILYASGECRHLFVNLSLTLASLFLILKDLQRNLLAGGLTRASARSNPYIYEEK